MASSKTIGYTSQTREIKITGTVGAEFELYIKKGTNYYNWDTDAFSPGEKILRFQKIPSSGVFTKNYTVPTVTADTSYDFYLNVLPGTTLTVPTTHGQKMGTLFQKGQKTATFTATESSTLVVQNSGSAGTDLTGGTLTSTGVTLTQTGTITEGSSKFVYCHTIPTWDSATGGSWTNSNYVETSLVEKLTSDGTKIRVTAGTGTNIASGYAVLGDNIVDEITVSAISGDIVTLSAGQDLNVGQTLNFSKSGWKVGPLQASVTTNTSGTATVSMTTTHEIEKVGIANLSCVLDVDDHFSVKPNAFPVENIECPAGGDIVIFPIVDCTNALGTTGDTDANVASKTYKVHTHPADGTSSRPIENEDGTITYVDLSVQGSVSPAEGANMGSAGAAEVTYTAHADMIAGDKDFFYYKTTDGQTPNVDSSTTQGKISITIV